MLHRFERRDRAGELTINDYAYAMTIDAPRPEQTAATASEGRDPRTFIESLSDELEATLPGISLHFHDPQHGVEVDVDRGGRHSLSYRLRHAGVTLGEVTLRSRNRFDGTDIDRVEAILARALPALAEHLAALHDATSDIDADTGLQSRAALQHLLARTPVGPVGLMAIRIDTDADSATVRRVALQIAAVLGDPDRAYRIGARTFAVSLYEADACAARFLAERIRLMVAAMPTTLPAPTVTVIVADISEHSDATLERMEARLDAHRATRNRVITP